MREVSGLRLGEGLLTKRRRVGIEEEEHIDIE